MADHTSGGNPDVLLNIHVALARIEEKQEAGTRAVDAQYANVMMVIAHFVPRAEIEREHRSIHTRMDGIDDDVAAIGKRVDRTENRLWGAAVAIIMAFVGIVANAFGVHLKPGG